MKNIINCIKEFAAANDFKFGGGFPRLMNHSKLEFPMIWLEPIELVAKNGVNEGVVSYKVKLHALTRNQNYSQQQKEDFWAEMQGRVVELCDKLYLNESIVNVRNLNCAPTETALTNYGELSVGVTLEVDSLYCNQNFGL